MSREGARPATPFRSAFVFAMAGRELRASRGRLLLYGSCMALGIAALVSLHGFRSATLATVDAEARELLGADLMLSSRAPFSPEAEAAISRLEASSGRTASRVTVFGSMALAEEQGRTRMVEVRGIEGGFPFYGELRTNPPAQWQSLVEPGGGEGASAAPRALVDPAVLVQLAAPSTAAPDGSTRAGSPLEVGGSLKLGQLRFEIAGEVTRAPGGIGLRQSVAPRVYVPGRFVERTGLIERGSLVEYLLYFAVDDPALIETWIEAERTALEGQRVRLRTVEDHREELSGSLSAFTRFLGLVGLVALLLGGVGVAAGVRAFASEKVDTAAVLRALGASQREVLAIYALQAAALGAAGAVVGTLIGLLAQLALPEILSALLPIEVPFRVLPVVLLVAFGLGLWVAVLFALWPLLELGSVPPLRALRRDFTPEVSGGSSGRFSASSLAIVLALGASLVAAAIWQAPTLRSGLAFAAGFALALAVLAASARLAIAGLRGAVPRSAPYWLRQGVANLFRPRNQTAPVVLAIGAGVFLVATLHLVERSLLESMERDQGSERPNLVLFDVQADQRADVLRQLEARGAPLLETAPIISARIAGLNDDPVDVLLQGAANEGERGRRWALGREYRLTYSERLRPSESVVAGAWWPAGASYAQEPYPVSLEDDLARSLGVGVGDLVVWDVQGVQVPSRIASLRKVDWGRLATNFFVAFAPGALEAAPQSFVMLSRLEGELERAELQRDLVAAHPNVAALDATVIMRAVDAIVDELGIAVRFMAGYTLATGFAILLAAVSTSRFQRARESLLLRTLGADGRTVRNVMTAEHMTLGALAATVGLGLAYLAAWSLVTFWFELSLTRSALGPSLLWLSVVGVCLVAGRANTRRMLREAPLEGLRRLVET